MRIAQVMSTIGVMFSVLAISTREMESAESAHTVLVEAEGFENLGGWVDDQQFMDEMGSPYLLAHGLGVPVRDATSSVKRTTQTSSQPRRSA